MGGRCASSSGWGARRGRAGGEAGEGLCCCPHGAVRSPTSSAKAVGLCSVLYWRHHQAKSPLPWKRKHCFFPCALQTPPHQRLQGYSSITREFSKWGVQRGSPAALCFGHDTTSLQVSTSGICSTFI